MRSSQHVLAATVAACLSALLLSIPSAGAAPPSPHWVASWGAAQQIPEPANELPVEQWRDASLRQIAHLSLGGKRFRVRISNAFGTAPVLVDGASVALARAPGVANIDAPTLRPLTFDGASSVMIPAGAEYYSDPVAMELKPAADLAISLYSKAEPARQTSHPGSRATSFIVKGNHVMDAAWQDAGTFAHWYMVADVEVETPHAATAVVAIGDSITDGHGATTDANNRWPDLLAVRLRSKGASMGVVNAGIGGGRMLRDGLGPNLASRFDRDVLSRSGITHAIVMIGVNDMGILHRNTADTPADRLQLLASLKLAHRQLADRAHAHGVCLIGGTVTPYAGSDYYHPNAENEADRQELNDWMRHSDVFDAVADFDAALRDPAQADRLRKAFDSGDGLHPSPAGFRAMADAVPLAALEQRCGMTR